MVSKEVIIHLGVESPQPSSGLPASFLQISSEISRASLIEAYLALHHVGFTMPSMSPSKRWALTPPFHPYPKKPRRFVFCGTFRRVYPPFLLGSTLPCGVRTFLLPNLWNSPRHWKDDHPLSLPAKNIVPRFEELGLLSNLTRLLAYRQHTRPANEALF